MKKRKSICVFCGSRMGNEQSFSNAAQSLAPAFVKRNFDLVYGGASVGLMGVIADECLHEKLSVTGVLPESFHTRELAHQDITRLIKVKTMHERKFKMYELSDAFLIIPGGLGTLDEMFEIVTWKQIGLHNKPIAVWNFENYFTELWNFLQKMQKRGFVSELESLIHISPDLNTLLDRF